MKKRFLSCLMAFMLTVSLLGTAPIAAFADELEQNVAVETAEENANQGVASVNESPEPSTADGDAASVNNPTFGEDGENVAKNETGDADGALSPESPAQTQDPVASSETSQEDAKLETPRPTAPEMSPLSSSRSAASFVTLGGEFTGTVEVAALNANGSGNPSMMNGMLEQVAAISKRADTTHVVLHFQKATLYGQPVSGIDVTALTSYSADGTAYPAQLISSDATTGDSFFKVLIPDTTTDTKVDMIYNGRTSSVLLHLGTPTWADDGEGDDGDGEGDGDNGDGDDGDNGAGDDDSGDSANDNTHFKLDDGSYTINGDLVKINRTDSSMASSALLNTVVITVENGVYYATIEVAGISAMGLSGYLSSLKYYDEGFTYDAYGNPQGSLQSAQVLEIQRDALGNPITDEHNSISTPYPQKLKFPLAVNTIKNENFVPLQVNVPLLGAFAAQDVLLRLDWTSLRAENDSKSQAANKTALLALIASVSTKKASDYTSASFEALQAALSAAKTVADKQGATQEEVDAQVVVLGIAVNNLVPAPVQKTDNNQASDESAASQVNAFGLADGKYQVQVNLWHASLNQASMGNDSLNHTALLEVINGSMYLSLSVHPMQVGTITTSLTSLQVRQPNGSYAAANVTAYNLAGGKPSAYRFAIYNLDSYLPVRVDPQVAIMGSGLIDARLLFNWGTLKAVSSSTVVSSNIQTAVSNFSSEDVAAASLQETSSDKAQGSTAGEVTSSKTGAATDSTQTIADSETPLVPASILPFIWIGLFVVLVAAVGTVVIVRFKLGKARSQVRQ